MKKNKENKKEERELGGVIENKKENYPPTGEWSQEKPEVSDECIGCAQCMRFCPEGAISIKKINGRRRAIVDLEFCKGCGICIGQCPVKAIKMKEV